MEIKILKNGFKMDEAYKHLMKKSKGKIKIDNMEAIFYPYELIEFAIEYKGRLSKNNAKCLCLADLVKGEYAIAKSRGEFNMMEVDDTLVMPLKVDRQELIDKAPSYIFGEILREKRMWHNPEINYLQSDLIYKPFYVVQCINEENEVFHVLFDAVSGGFVMLN